MTTALDQINGACKLLGILAAGETLPSEDSEDALEAFNQMLDSWTNEDLLIYASTRQELVWTANNASQTIGPTGDIVGVRPVSIDSRTFFTDSDGNDYSVIVLSEEEYNAIADKDETSTYPVYLFINYTPTNITAYVYPVPTQNLTWTFVSATELPQPSTLATTLSFPPGYKRAFKYNLAVELAPMFGLQPPPDVKVTAMATKRILKRVNQRIEDLRMRLPSSLPGMSSASSILSGV